MRSWWPGKLINSCCLLTKVGFLFTTWGEITSREASRTKPGKRTSVSEGLVKEVRKLSQKFLLHFPCRLGPLWASCLLLKTSFQSQTGYSDSSSWEHR